MKEVLLILVHLAVMVAKLCRPGGVRAVMSENLLLKQQLIVVGRIARIISRTFGVDIDKNVVYRVLATHYRPSSGGTGPSWLSLLGHATDSV